MIRTIVQDSYLTIMSASITIYLQSCGHFCNGYGNGTRDNLWVCCECAQARANWCNICALKFTSPRLNAQ